MKKNINYSHLGFKVSKDWLPTSQNPCQGHSLSKANGNRNSSLEEVIEYTNTGVVCKISHELNMDNEEAENLFTDLKKILWAASRSHINTTPSPLIDEAWHRFILFTEDYKEFCYKYFGDFIHHLPHVPNNEQAGNEVLKPTIEYFYKTFSCKPSSNWDYVNV